VCHCYRNINAISSRPIFLSRNDFKQRERRFIPPRILSHTHRAPVRSFFLRLCAHPASEKRTREILYPPRFLSYFHKGKVNRAQWDGICANNAPLFCSLPHFAAKVHCCVGSFVFPMQMRQRRSVTPKSKVISVSEASWTGVNFTNLKWTSTRKHLIFIYVINLQLHSRELIVEIEV
jgi:hypothetical protein